MFDSLGVLTFLKRLFDGITNALTQYMVTINVRRRRKDIFLSIEGDQRENKLQLLNQQKQLRSHERTPILLEREKFK